MPGRMGANGVDLARASNQLEAAVDGATWLQERSAT